MSILDNVVTAIFNPPRGIGGIAIQCCVEEHHYDELVVTDHPVEMGAEISDHAYKRPAEVVIRAGWSNSGLSSLITDIADVASLLLNGVTGFSGLGAAFNYADQVYQQLLTLQASREPISIITGKRSYSNMLIRALSVTTDEKTGHALFCTAICRQVIIAQTQFVSFTSIANLASPAKNAQTENTGVKQLTTGSPSPGGAAPPSAWGLY